MSAENIRKIYEKMSEDRSAFDRKLGEIQEMSKCAQDAFNELARGNSDLGAGVIPPILRCLTSHVLSAATNSELTKEERYAEVSGYLAPLVAMHYDVYTKECLDNIDSILNESEAEG